MSERLDIEYCKYCEDVYATNTSVWLAFEYYGGETYKADDLTCFCPRCNCEMLRHTGYLDSLRRRDDASYLDDIVSNIYDLSDEAKALLRMLLANFSVPSFAVIFEGKIGDNVQELVKKRYVQTTQRDGGGGFIELNAYKLRLFDNVDILKNMTSQRCFILYPEHLRSNREHSDRRKKRMDALPNTFTDEQKAELLRKFNGKCAFTGKDVPIQIDHVIPVASGHGGTIIENMLPVWQRINSSKGDRNVFEWYEKNGERFEVVPELFEQAIGYIAELNGMSYEEYREYVYGCHNAKLTQTN